MAQPLAEGVVYPPHGPASALSEEDKDFGDGTMRRVLALYEEDQRRLSRRWTTGMPLFDNATTTMRSALVCLAAEENMGKTNLALNLYQGILDYTPGSVVLDFVLDDSFGERVHCLAASKGKISIQDVVLPSLLDKGDERRARRTAAYKEIVLRYKQRLAIFDTDSLRDAQGVAQASRLDRIVSEIASYRERFPEAPLWVNIDALDDIEVSGVDPEDKIAHISEVLKRATKRYDCVIFATKHKVKGQGGRSAGTDSLGGRARLKYNCQLILVAYSEVGDLGQASEIYFERDDKPDGHKSPVFEVRFKKNKVGDFKGLVCYHMYPEWYWMEECSSELQEDYHALIADAAGGSSRR